MILDDSSSDVDETPSRAPAPAPARTKAKTSRAKIDKLNAPIPALKIAATPRVKDEQSTGLILAACGTLYCSPEPMTFMAKGESNQSAAAAVAAVQTVLDSEYPGNNLTVEWGDKICFPGTYLPASGERRSAIGQAGVDAIPSPENSPRDPKAKGYIKYMDTPLMIKTVAPFLKDTKFYDFSGMPIGLFALGGAGVERGVNLYTETGVRPDKPPKFSKAASNTAVAGFVKNIRLFTLNRWETLLDAGGVEEPVAAMDDYRGEIYVPSSPM
ncbi:hypothetical protein B0H14DRAFT_3000887 [Mycena olivaceomarginata]|nr:hypothetical protein B0H14DRAFT_3000887 [Mycena olivaceomarginata]